MFVGVSLFKSASQGVSIIWTTLMVFWRRRDLNQSHFFLSVLKVEKDLGRDASISWTVDCYILFGCWYGSQEKERKWWSILITSWTGSRLRRQISGHVYGRISRFGDLRWENLNVSSITPWVRVLDYKRSMWTQSEHSPLCFLTAGTMWLSHDPVTVTSAPWRTVLQTQNQRKPIFPKLAIVDLLVYYNR